VNEQPSDSTHLLKTPNNELSQTAQNATQYMKSAVEKESNNNKLPHTTHTHTHTHTHLKNNPLTGICYWPVSHTAAVTAEQCHTQSQFMMESLCGCDRVEVFRSELHADGVRATAPIVCGEVLFREKPFCFLQSLENRANVLVCSCCHGFIGSQETCLALLERKIDRQALVNELSSAAAGTENTRGMVSCDQCCGELYCSEDCKVKHWCNGHYLLCTGNVSEAEASTHPLILFKAHAINTNEIFLLVADVFASIIASAEGMNGLEPVPVDVILGKTASYVRGLWWDVAIEPEKKSKKAPLSSTKLAAKRKKFQDTLKTLVKDSWTYLSAALNLAGRGLDKHLSMEYMSRTIGMFEQNNVGVIASTPLSQAILKSAGNGTILTILISPHPLTLLSFLL
jgi:hypothetical protein